MLFTSKLCDVCKNALHLAFKSIEGRTSPEIPHHLTKESLIDSVLHRSCHLCRLILYHLKLHWSPLHRQGLKDLKEEPTTLTEKDFESSDFDFATFPADRVIVRSYMLELPEVLNLHAQISKYRDGLDGIFGIVQFDCIGPMNGPLKDSTPRFWIFDESAFGAPVVTSRVNDNTAAAGCQSILKEWLNHCSGHSDCGMQQQSFLPTRLLDLGDVDSKGQVRLVLSQDLDHATRYVTLSHCWGGNVPFQLRDETMQKMVNGFGLEELPKTFQQAILVARWVNVRYIWIDSCCIIQGSFSDWEKEAKMMQKVYKHTHFNISADHSNNSHEGCFMDRLAYKFTPCPFIAPKLGQVYLVSQFDITRPLKESPIASRAWVLQERFLSPRVLHFTTDQIFWECPGLYACETFPQGMPHVYDYSKSRHYRSHLTFTQANEEDGSKVYEVWGRICEDYSRSALTYTSDKLIAFAGIVSEFQSRLPNDKYLAGIWKADLINGLLWKAAAIDGWPIQPNGSHNLDADPYITSSMPDTYRAPSWSWLAKDCGIVWQASTRYSPQALVKILEAKVDFVDGDDHAGTIQGGHLTVRGCLRAARWKQEGNIDSIILDGKSGNQLQLTAPEHEALPKNNSFVLQRDTGMEFPVRDVYCLLVRLSIQPGGTSQKAMMIEGLILGPTEGADTYKRLGHFEARGEAYCKALVYELRAPAQELDQPRNILNLQSATGTGETQTDENGAGLHYDEKYFREIEERELTIV
ncbi:heterokaryon incompatibility protein-domain-containing protein [Pyrenochaeta sp. MPI-SDFR-AT-0127]|nr:heterokaryon incompatibility protein-domain-containing protein [Pyrenochaeta sp. MPI-SDFR-AT-0127]